MNYAKSAKVIEAIDTLITYVQCREREKNKGGEDTVWSEVAYYSTLIAEAKETIFDMVATADEEVAYLSAIRSNV
mgnify:CR=1 FL=1|tara:strand:- start:89 stop:313 length:225 start_codon:yes stop_codon:yes gene_type:complete